MSKTMQWSYAENRLVSKFKRIFVLKPVRYDLSSLNDYCDEVVYATSGSAEGPGEIKEALEISLKDFDPYYDALLALGGGNLCFIAGMVLMERLSKDETKQEEGIVTLSFANDRYHFWNLPLKPGAIPYEMSV